MIRLLFLHLSKFLINFLLVLLIVLSTEYICKSAFGLFLGLELSYNSFYSLTFMLIKKLKPVKQASAQATTKLKKSVTVQINSLTLLI